MRNLLKKERDKPSLMDEYKDEIDRFDKLMEDSSKQKNGGKKVLICIKCGAIVTNLKASSISSARFGQLVFQCRCGSRGPFSYVIL